MIKVPTTFREVEPINTFHSQLLHLISNFLAAGGDKSEIAPALREEETRFDEW